jgi:D-xylose transport system substrate-binding protein
MKKTMMFLLALLFVLLTGCESTQVYKNDDGEIKIGFMTDTMTVERWARDRDIFVNKAEELGAEVIVKNGYEDSERQIQIGKEMIDQGVDVLAVVAYDKDTLGDLVKYAKSQNVKFIAYDRLIKNADVDLYISFDNYAVGRLMAQNAVENVKRGNYLILNGPETDNNVFMINEACREVLEPYIDDGSIHVVGETFIDAWRDEVAYEYVSAKISEGVHIDAIIAGDDRLAEGAINALSENRLAGSVYVTGQDAELGACQRIVEGTQSMTVYKPIDALAEGAAEIAVKMAQGESLEDVPTIHDGTYDVPYIVYEPIPVTSSNMMSVIIEDGFYMMEEVYQHVPKSMWPK